MVNISLINIGVKKLQNSMQLRYCLCQHYQKQHKVTKTAEASRVHLRGGVDGMDERSMEEKCCGSCRGAGL